MRELSAPFKLNDGGTWYFGIHDDRGVITFALEDSEGNSVRVEMAPDEAENMSGRLAIAVGYVKPATSA